MSLKIKVSFYVDEPLCIAVLVGEEKRVATVNLGSDIGNNSLMPMYCAFIDVNNYPSASTKLAELMEPYTRFGEPVYMCTNCRYPLYQFNKKKLKELDPEGCAKYEEEYLKRFNALLEKMQQEFFG